MSSKKQAFTIEIPAGVSQQEYWKLDEELNELDGVEADLREPKGLESLDPAMIGVAINIAITVVTQALQHTETIQKMAKKLYDLTHPAGKEKRKVVITKKDGTRIELENLSEKEVQKLLAGE